MCCLSFKEHSQGLFLGCLEMCVANYLSPQLRINQKHLVRFPWKLFCSDKNCTFYIIFAFFELFSDMMRDQLFKHRSSDTSKPHTSGAKISAAEPSGELKRNVMLALSESPVDAGYDWIIYFILS